jgi:hypothetical protein
MIHNSVTNSNSAYILRLSQVRDVGYKGLGIRRSRELGKRELGE